MKKIIEIYIIVIILLIIGTTASFAVSGTITTNGVRMRTAPTTDSEIITNLNNGQSIEIIEKDGAWYKIKYEENEGYIHSDYVRADGEVTIVNEQPAEETPVINEPETETPVEEVVPEQENVKEEEAKYPLQAATTVNVKMYVIPSVTSSVTITIEQGKTLTINNKINNWSYVEYENKEGWVRNYALENKTEQPPAVSNEPEPYATFKGYINSESINLREEPSMSANVLATIVQNTEITVTGEDGDWYKVDYREYKGYIAKRLINEKPISTITSRSLDEPRQTVELEDKVQEETSSEAQQTENVATNTIRN
jgi:uncharacterized protein YgiM (DUF1202 family)